MPWLSAVAELAVVPLKATAASPSEEPGGGGVMSVRTISMPSTSGLFLLCEKSMLTVPSLVMLNAFIVPVWSPTSATMSYLLRTVVPSIATLNVRDPEALVHVQRLAKYSRTWSGVPDVTGNVHFIAGLSEGDHRSLSKMAFGVVAGTVALDVAPGL